MGHYSGGEYLKGVALPPDEGALPTYRYGGYMHPEVLDYLLLVASLIGLFLLANWD